MKKKLRDLLRSHWVQSTATASVGFFTITDLD